jgi:hypothetical protein
VDHLTAEISLPTALMGVIAVLSPYLTAFFIRCNMSAKVKQVISVVVSVVLALGYCLFKGDITDWDTFIKAVPTIYMISQLTYALLLKKSAEVVEAKYGVTAKSEEPTAAADTENAKAADADEDSEADVNITAEELVVHVEGSEETPRKG